MGNGRLRRHADTIERHVGAEVLVVRGGRTDVVRLSGPAAIVWGALSEPTDRHALVNRLAPAAPPGVDVSGAVVAGIDALLAADLVEPLPS